MKKFNNEKIKRSGIIEDINTYLIKENRKQKDKIRVAEVELEVLKLLHITYSDIEELSDTEKAKIFETIELIKEKKHLKEIGEKLNEEIDEYIKKLDKSSYIMEQKVKVKRGKDKDH